MLDALDRHLNGEGIAQMGNTHPELGTAEFDEQMDRQGQAAMNAALAHPVGRVFAVVVFIVTIVIMPSVGGELIWGEAPLWFRIIQGFVVFYGCALVLFETGSIIVTGKSRIPWYRHVSNRWRVRR